MTKQEVAKLLAKISLIDNRKVDALTLAEWFDIVGHLDFEHAVEAVREHRQSSTEYLQPAHIVSIAYRLGRGNPSRESARLALAEIESARSKAVPMPESLRAQMLGGRDV